MWTTQVWIPRLRRLLIDHPLVLPKHPRSLILLFSQGKAHPLQKTLTLLACKSSGTLTQQEAFCKKLPKSSGIDVSRFKPHSVRASSTSAAALAKVLLDIILRTAGWSGHCTFANYY